MIRPKGVIRNGMVRKGATREGREIHGGVLAEGVAAGTLTIRGGKVWLGERRGGPEGSGMGTRGVLSVTSVTCL